MDKNLGKYIARIEKLEKDLSQTIGRIEELEKVVSAAGGVQKATQKKGATPSSDLDYSLNERTFVNRYATGKSGPRRFTILLAYLAHGKVDKNVEISEIRKRWNKMSAKYMLGKFNMFYPNEAKTRGFVDSKQYGFYSLTKEWKNTL
ncbi:MAG: hypothetical protein FVQ85_01540 [Planctomycetes bacterium]|nr:hypothetical protein [Planctomycetota bacterium]